MAIGDRAGNTGQYDYSVAIGPSAGQTSQGSQSVAIGNTAGQTSQNAFSVAIGTTAGQTGQGTLSVAIGPNAGQTNQHDGTIILNASGTALNSTQASSTFIAPIRTPSPQIASTLLGYTTSYEMIQTIITVDSSGIVTATGFNSTSDVNLKEFIEPLPLDYSKNIIQNLRPVQYAFNGDGKHKIRFGFIAQEVKELIGDQNLGIHSDAGAHQSLSYQELIAPLVNTVKDLLTTVEKLNQRILNL